MKNGNSAGGCYIAHALGQHFSYLSWASGLRPENQSHEVIVFSKCEQFFVLSAVLLGQLLSKNIVKQYNENCLILSTCLEGEIFHEI